MTFATHLERQFMQRLRGAGWVNASALPPSPRLVQTLLQKRLDRDDKIRPDRSCPLSAYRRGFERKEVAHPNPTETTVLEGEMISLVATRKLVINKSSVKNVALRLGRVEAPQGER